MILSGDLLDHAVGVTEPDELGEGARFARRRQAVEGVALPADDEPLEAEDGVFGRAGGLADGFAQQEEAKFVLSVR